MPLGAETLTASQAYVAHGDWCKQVCMHASLMGSACCDKGSCAVRKQHVILLGALSMDMHGKKAFWKLHFRIILIYLNCLGTPTSSHVAQQAETGSLSD